MMVRNTCRPTTSRRVLRSAAVVAVLVVATIGVGAGTALASDGPVPPGSGQDQDPPPTDPDVALVPEQLATKIVELGPADDVPTAGPDQHALERKAVVRPVVVNSGSAAATLSFAASLDRNTEPCRGDDVVARGPAPPRLLPPLTPETREVTLFLPVGCSGQTGFLMISVSGAPPVTVPFTLSEDFTLSQLWWPVGLAAAVGVVFLVATFVRLTSEKLVFGDVRTGPSWSFADSWATNVSALGGVLLTILSASELLTLLLPGRDTDRLVGLNIVFTALVLIAPVVYSAACIWRYEAGAGGKPALVATGRAFGVAFAACATLVGATGQLFTVLLVAWVSPIAGPTSTLFRVLALAVAAAVLLLGVYAYRFVFGVTTRPPSQIVVAGDLSAAVDTPARPGPSAVSGTL